MLCEWFQCRGISATVILSGCLEMHLEVRHYCYPHALKFTEMMKLELVSCAKCPYEKQAEYLVYSGRENAV